MGRTWAVLSDMLGVGPKPAPKRAAKPAPRVAPIDPLEGRLEELVRHLPAASSIIGGTLELVGLDRLPSATVESWSLTKDRIRQIAESELKRQLGMVGLYRMYNATTFLICFANKDKDEAEHKLKSVSRQISETVLREIPAVRDTVRPQPFVASIDPVSLEKGGGKLVDRLFASVQQLREDAARVGVSLTRLVGRTNLLFAPVWSPSKNIVAFNRCILDSTMQTRNLERLQWELRGRGIGNPTAEIDCLVLSKAVGMLHGMVIEGRFTPLLVPVKYFTVSSDSTFRTYLKLIQSIPEPYSGLLALQVIDIPPEHSASSVLEVAKKLAPWVKWLSLRFALDDPRIPDCAQSPVWALAVDLHQSRSTDSLLYPQLRRLRSIAAAAKMNTFAQGVNSTGLTMASVRAGISYLDGSAVHPAALDPRTLGPFKPVLSTFSSSRVVRRRA